MLNRVLYWKWARMRKIATAEANHTYTHTHTHIYIYIYIRYTCVCVWPCVCMNNIMEYQPSQKKNLRPFSVLVGLMVKNVLLIMRRNIREFALVARRDHSTMWYKYICKVFHPRQHFVYCNSTYFTPSLTLFVSLLTMGHPPIEWHIR